MNKGSGNTDTQGTAAPPSSSATGTPWKRFYDESFLEENTLAGEPLRRRVREFLASPDYLRRSPSGRAIIYLRGSRDYDSIRCASTIALHSLDYLSRLYGIVVLAECLRLSAPPTSKALASKTLLRILTHAPTENAIRHGRHKELLRKSAEALAGNLDQRQISTLQRIAGPGKWRAAWGLAGMRQSSVYRRAIEWCAILRNQHGTLEEIRAAARLALAPRTD